MPDGKRIQELNIDDIPSIRRNPIICDIFSRLKLMERRGSGLRKIIDEYPDDLAPSFRSTAQSFIVTLMNSNYCNASMPNDDIGINVGIDKNAEKVLKVLASEPYITQLELSAEIGLSLRTVGRELKCLRDAGIIRRVGSPRSGYWEIRKN